MVIPADLPEQFRTRTTSQIPIHYKSVDEPSQITYLRLREVLDAGRRDRGRAAGSRTSCPRATPSRSRSRARTWPPTQELGGNVWSRLFPFLLVMMSLTGAFYPAVDLCAGEKERGTMETLLISPATRAEIVLGKFLTVMLASMMTALLNLVSMGLTGHPAGAGQASVEWPRRRAGTPLPRRSRRRRLQSAFWMILLLIPLSAFFSAICLALAVLARSMKEGQYYMTPLYLVCLPLIFLTLVPGDRAEPVLQPGAGHRRRAPAAGPDHGRLPDRGAVLPAGAGADGRLRRGRPAVGDRPVPARGGPVPRGRAVRPGALAAGTCSATGSRRRPAARRCSASP